MKDDYNWIDDPEARLARTRANFDFEARTGTVSEPMKVWIVLRTDEGILNVDAVKSSKRKADNYVKRKSKPYDGYWYEAEEHEVT